MRLEAPLTMLPSSSGDPRALAAEPGARVRRMSVLVALLIASPFASAEASELRVGVLPFSGSVDPTARALATQILMDALAGMRGIAVVSFTNVDAVLGAEAKRALEACTDDRCIVAKTSAIKTDGLVIGSLDDEGGAILLRVRMV